MFTRIDHRPSAAAIAACLMGLVLAQTAGAIDLRDWGRKFAASQRFVVLSQFGNQAVLDKETQLVWQRTPASFEVSWISAKGGCAQLALGGRRGWRLPAFHELASLVQPDPPIGVLALPAGHPFKSVQLGGYWTSTRVVSDSGQPLPFAIGVLFTAPAHNFNSSTQQSSHHFWCVRGGGPISEY